MTFSELLASDLPLLKELQPPDWNNIVPPFEYHISHSFCRTRKIMDGNRIAAVGTTVLHKNVAWLALIIVHPDYRGQGLGKKITMDLMDIATKHECESILLLATPMGFPVYEKLGFISESEYTFFRATKPYAPTKTDSHVISFDPVYTSQVLQLDKWASGEDRSFRILEYINDSLLYVVNNTVEGFYLPGLGEGLIVAMNDAAGLSLLNERLKTRTEGVVPDENTTVLNFYENHDFIPFRKAVRMRLGQPIYPELHLIYSRVSGQIG